MLETRHEGATSRQLSTNAAAAANRVSVNHTEDQCVYRVSWSNDRPSSYIWIIAIFCRWSWWWWWWSGSHMTRLRHYADQSSGGKERDSISWTISEQVTPATVATAGVQVRRYGGVMCFLPWNNKVLRQKLTAGSTRTIVRVVCVLITLQYEIIFQILW